MGWLHLPPQIWSWLLRLLYYAPQVDHSGRQQLAPWEDTTFHWWLRDALFLQIFFAWGSGSCCWLSVDCASQDSNHLLPCSSMWASPDPNYLLRDWVTFCMPAFYPGTYAVRARTGTPSRGGDWGLYFSFSKGMKWLKAAPTFGCLSMNCHPCLSQVQSVMLCHASWWLWQHTLGWNVVLSVFSSLCSGSCLSSMLGVSCTFVYARTRWASSASASPGLSCYDKSLRCFLGGGTISKGVLCEGKPQSLLRAGAGLAGNHWKKTLAKPKTVLLLPQLWKCQVDFEAVELI